MTIETVLLLILCSTLSLTVFGGKIMFALWVWFIFFTFPGTYSTQPAITTQTFGHKYGGTIYGFLFTSDIVNNFLISYFVKPITSTFGWQGLFLTMAASAAFGLVVTCFFPWRPYPEMIKSRFVNSSSSNPKNSADNEDDTISELKLLPQTTTDPSASKVSKESPDH